jgi:hypothetical protein
LRTKTIYYYDSMGIGSCLYGSVRLPQVVTNVTNNSWIFSDPLSVSKSGSYVTSVRWNNPSGGFVSATKDTPYLSIPCSSATVYVP